MEEENGVREPDQHGRPAGSGEPRQEAPDQPGESPASQAESPASQAESGQARWDLSQLGGSWIEEHPSGGTGPCHPDDSQDDSDQSASARAEPARVEPVGDGPAHGLPAYDEPARDEPGGAASSGVLVSDGDGDGDQRAWEAPAARDEEISAAQTGAEVGGAGQVGAGLAGAGLAGAGQAGAGQAGAGPDPAAPSVSEQAGSAPGEEGRADGGAGRPVAAVRAPDTGEPRVDAALRLLDDLTEQPVTEHPAVFQQVHARLAEVLDELGSGPLAGPPAAPPGRNGR